MFKHAFVALSNVEHIPNVVLQTNDTLHKEHIGHLHVRWVDVVKVRQILLVLHDLIVILTQDVW